MAGISLDVATGQGGLFEDVVSERLFACNALRHRHGRSPHLAQPSTSWLDKKRLQREALAQGLGMTRSQLQSLLPLWTRWLNVTGQVILWADYEAVWLDAETVKGVLGR